MKYPITLDGFKNKIGFKDARKYDTKEVDN